jgi:hypothetical protein
MRIAAVPAILLTGPILSGGAALAAEPRELDDATLDQATAGLLQNFSLTIVAPITVVTNIVTATAIGVDGQDVTATAIGNVTAGNDTEVTAGLSFAGLQPLSDAGEAGMLNNTSLTIVVPVTVVTNQVESSAVGLSSSGVTAGALGNVVGGNQTNVLDLLGL